MDGKLVYSAVQQHELWEQHPRGLLPHSGSRLYLFGCLPRRPYAGYHISGGQRCRHSHQERLCRTGKADFADRNSSVYRRDTLGLWLRFQKGRQDTLQPLRRHVADTAQGTQGDDRAAGRRDMGVSEPHEREVRAGSRAGSPRIQGAHGEPARGAGGDRRHGFPFLRDDRARIPLQRQNGAVGADTAGGQCHGRTESRAPEELPHRSRLARHGHGGIARHVPERPDRREHL